MSGTVEKNSSSRRYSTREEMARLIKAGAVAAVIAGSLTACSQQTQGGMRPGGVVVLKGK